jgi:2-C-methyl-D-erythritol 4-phosphate cytidylyltransferase
MNFAIVAAGGKGTRFSGPTSKQLALLNGRPLVLWSLALFEQEPQIQEVVLVRPEDEADDVYRLLVLEAGLTKIRIIAGGPTRFDSVRNGFRSLHANSDADVVLIHDAARPLASPALTARVLASAIHDGTGLPVMPIQETIKEVTQGHVVKTWPRERMCVAQTPQAFRYGILEKAYVWSDQHKLFRHEITDEALLVEKAGFPVTTVGGDKRNLKITEPEDLKLAEYYIEVGAGL